MIGLLIHGTVALCILLAWWVCSFVWPTSPLVTAFFLPCLVGQLSGAVLCNLVSRLGR